MDENILLNEHVTELTLELDTTLAFSKGQAFMVKELYSEIQLLQGTMKEMVTEQSICRREKFDLENQVVVLKGQRNKARLVAGGAIAVILIITVAAVVL